MKVKINLTVWWVYDLEKNWGLYIKWSLAKPCLTSGTEIHRPNPLEGGFPASLFCYMHFLYQC